MSQSWGSYSVCGKVCEGEWKELVCVMVESTPMQSKLGGTGLRSESGALPSEEETEKKSRQ